MGRPPPNAQANATEPPEEETKRLRIRLLCLWQSVSQRACEAERGALRSAECSPEQRAWLRLPSSPKEAAAGGSPYLDNIVTPADPRSAGYVFARAAPRHFWKSVTKKVK